MPLQNPFINYVQRSYEQIKQAVVDKLAVLTPEITDHTESNILVRILSVWAGIAEMIGYYINNMAREQFLSNCRLYFSAIKIAREYDYRVASSQAASVRLKFTFQNNSTNLFTGFTIPAGTEVQNDDGIIFYTTEEVIVPASNLNTIEVFVDAVNLIPVTGVNIGTSDGTANQEFVIDDFVGGFSVAATISAVLWTGQETLAYSCPTDQHFRQTVNEDKKVIIQFGDDVNGAIPTAAADIIVDYDRTDGVDGNVEANTITTINTALPPVPTGFTLSVTNPARASGGTDVESLASLKKHIPLFIRTQNRAVTDQDFIDIGNLHPQVAQTSADYECGKFVDVYIVPDGGGIATDVLVADVLLWYEDRRIITTNLRVFAAGEIRLQLDIDLNVLPNYIQANIQQDVIDNLVAFFDYTNQQIGGTVHISDIYAIIENTTGVNNSTINAIIPVPYARPVPPTTNVLDWARTIQPASTTTDFWGILFTSATNFQLTKNGNLVGTFSAGTLVVQTEIEFTVNGTYAIGDRFEFVTYPYSANNLDLQEQSIPTSLSGDISITATGGQ